MTDNEKLEAFRYRMMTKGYMNKSELARFMECGYKRANKAYQQMMSDTEQEGLERLNNGFILTKRAITYLGLTERKVIEAYERSK